ncbi:helix-turn-helix transcriptional regulator [Acidobacteria bacterium AH-259-O06]|nr:helix-turn-helix transcriptional regulator [Acidobacteria bacterium AH-259-O06]
MNILKKFREQANYSQAKLARRLGKSVAWVSRVEGGTLALTDAAAVSLACVLDVPVAAIRGAAKKIKQRSQPSDV